MSGSWLTTARKQKGWTQQEAAARFGVSQTYWSLLEHGRRPVPARLLATLRRRFKVPATLAPLAERPAPQTAEALAAALAGLGYPGFAYLRPRTFVNPAVLLLAALRRPDLETRLAEALPWVAWHYRGLDWTWLLDRMKVADLQNRLGFVVSLAKQVASSKGDHAAVSTLAAVEQRLERARLVREDTLCREGMSQTERRWLGTARSPEAAHWNLLSDLRADRLPYAA
jgi:transcriptional regulator with XRE-family HTH domain